MEIRLARIRILVAKQPCLIRESFTYTVADQDDVEIVGQAEDVAEIPDLVEETRPDCVIISPEKPRQRPPICDALLGLYPSIRFIPRRLPAPLLSKLSNPSASDLQRPLPRPCDALPVNPIRILRSNHRWTPGIQ